MKRNKRNHTGSTLLHTFSAVRSGNRKPATGSVDDEVNVNDLDTAAAVSIKSIFDALDDGLKRVCHRESVIPSMQTVLLANKKIQIQLLTIVKTAIENQ